MNDTDCAICYITCVNPVQIDGCGHIFCYKCFRRWMCIKITCPLDRSVVKTMHVIDNESSTTRITLTPKDLILERLYPKYDRHIEKMEYHLSLIKNRFKLHLYRIQNYKRIVLGLNTEQDLGLLKRLLVTDMQYTLMNPSLVSLLEKVENKLIQLLDNIFQSSDEQCNTLINYTTLLTHHKHFDDCYKHFVDLCVKQMDDMMLYNKNRHLYPNSNDYILIIEQDTLLKIVNSFSKFTKELMDYHNMIFINELLNGSFDNVCVICSDETRENQSSDCVDCIELQRHICCECGDKWSIDRLQCIAHSTQERFEKIVLTSINRRKEKYDSMFYKEVNTLKTFSTRLVSVIVWMKKQTLQKKWTKENEGDYLTNFKIKNRVFTMEYINQKNNFMENYYYKKILDLHDEQINWLKLNNELRNQLMSNLNMHELLLERIKKVKRKLLKMSEILIKEYFQKQLTPNIGQRHKDMKQIITRVSKKYNDLIDRITTWTGIYCSSVMNYMAQLK